MPFHLYLVYAAISFLIGYCASMVLVGFPVSVWEYVTKKKADKTAENKVIIVVAICIAVAIFLKVISERLS